MCEFCQNFHPIKIIILNLETVQAAESHFYLASLQKKRRGGGGEGKGGEWDEKKWKDRGEADSKLNQEKKD